MLNLTVRTVGKFIIAVRQIEVWSSVRQGLSAPCPFCLHFSTLTIYLLDQVMVRNIYHEICYLLSEDNGICSYNEFVRFELQVDSLYVSLLQFRQTFKL